MADLAPEFNLLRGDWPIFAASDEPVRRTLNVISPGTGEVIAKVATAGDRHVQDALFAAFSMFRQKDRRLSASRRSDIFERVAQRLEENAELLSLEAARESGRPLRWCREDVQQAEAFARLARDLLAADTVAELPLGALGVLEPTLGLEPKAVQTVTMEVSEPLGVVVAVVAVNNPLEPVARALFSALLAGCPLIIKPAEDTPLSCLRLVHILHEAGLPHVWCQCVVTETHSLTEQLVTDPRVALLNFTGPEDVGWSLRARLPPGTRCLLEHGCVTPAIVAADADMQLAIQVIASDGLMQRAADGESIQRVFVPQASAKTFALALAERAARIVVGDPLQPETELGALVRENDQRRLRDWVDEAVAGGAELICGGVNLASQRFAPTVLLNPPLDSKVATQPACGPLVAVYGVRDIEEACDRANSLPLARLAVVFSSDSSAINSMFQRLDASRVVVNSAITDSMNQASGQSSSQSRPAGLRRSGLGDVGLLAASKAMQILRSLVLPDRGGT